MAFILLVRDGDTVRLFGPTVFETRQEALSELPHAGAIRGSEELFLVDLDAITPVIVVSQEPAATPVAPSPEDEAMADEGVGVWEAPAPVEEAAPEEPLSVEGPPAGDVVPAESEPQSSPELELVASMPLEAVPEPPVAAEPVVEESPVADEPAESLGSPPEEQEDLPSALRRAAGALESSGIAAPESVSSVPDVPEQTTPEEPETHAVAEEPEAHAAPEEPEAAAAPGPEEPAVVDVAPAAWPWDVAETEAPATAEVEESPVYVPDPLEEPARDVEPLVYADGAGEAVTQSRPVIMGSYDTVEGSISIEVPESPDAPQAAEAPEVPEAPEDTDEPPAYEAGASDIAELTCDECVYLATCPKKGESDPASCGSFQWKSV